MIIFLDVDGTIVDYENKLPSSCEIAIKKAIANGHTLVMCTGRSPSELSKDLIDLKIPGFIGGNGSYIEFNSKIIFKNSLSLNDCKEIIDFLKENDLEFFVEANSGLYASKHFETAAIPYMKEYVKGKGVDLVNFNLRKTMPHLIFGEKNLVRADVNKISYLLKDYKYHLLAKEKFPHLSNNTWGGNGHKALFGDIGVSKITKAFGIKKFLELSKLKDEKIAAIGDAIVDLSMFEIADYKIAMGNACPELKQAANFITNDINDDGIKKAFEYLGVI